MQRGLLTLLLLLHAARPGWASEPMVTVAIDVGGVAEQAFRELGLLDLQRKLVLRLAEAGFAVVAPDRSPIIRLSLEVVAGEIRATARAAGRAVARQVPRGQSELETYHLEVIHKSVEAARQAAPAPGAASAPVSPGPASAPAARPRPTPTLASPSPSTRPAPLATRHTRGWSPFRGPLELELGAGAMALLRLGELDPLLRLEGRLGGATGLGLRGSAAFSPAVHGTIQVYEWSLQGGASLRHALARTLYLEEALLLGLIHHIYHLGEATDALGGRFGFLGSLALQLNWQLLPFFSLWTWVAPGLTDHTRTHRLDDEVIWGRSFFRLELGLGLSLILR